MAFIRESECPFLALPYNDLQVVLSYCDLQSLGRLSRTCRKLHEIISESENLWIVHSRRALGSNQANRWFRERSFCELSAKEKLMLSRKWRKGIPAQHVVVRFDFKLAPWVYLDKWYLWYSKEGTVMSMPRRYQGVFNQHVRVPFLHHTDDVVKFIVTQDYIISGGRDSCVLVWERKNHFRSFGPYTAHESEVASVASSNDILVTGSKDKTVKVWSSLPTPALQYTVSVGDRVWDVAVVSQNSQFLSGSAALSNVPPLQLHDLESGTRLRYWFEGEFKEGAGVFHICEESPHEFYTGSYDGMVRLWDLRCRNACVKRWDDPYDSAVYCVATDRNVTFMSGTARHGVSFLWDKRASRHVQLFYIGKRNSPVYSLSFDATTVVAGIDRSVSALFFC